MTFIALPTVGAITLSLSGFVQAHPFLIHQVGGHALSHVFHSYVRYAGRKRSLNPRQLRKARNRKRRWFVDNIIMHHKRLHDKNREIVVGRARDSVLQKRKLMQKESPNLLASSFVREKPKSESSKWREAVDLRDRGKAIRGRVDARRLRARSRWMSVSDKKE